MFCDFIFNHIRKFSEKNIQNIPQLCSLQNIQLSKNTDEFIKREELQSS